VSARLDDGNATLAGLFANQLNRLLPVLYASALSIAGLRRSAHSRDALASFHWLRAPERIKFKRAVIVYRALDGSAPCTLSGVLRRVADVPSRSRQPVNSWSVLHVMQPSGNARLLQLVRDSGTIFWTILLLPHHCQRSDGN